jgi:Cu/Ag efflux pump CusA
MILLFLGSWRSTLIVLISIPLLILTLAAKSVRQTIEAVANGPVDPFDSSDREGFAN